MKRELGEIKIGNHNVFNSWEKQTKFN